MGVVNIPAYETLMQTMKAYKLQMTYLWYSFCLFSKVKTTPHILRRYSSDFHGDNIIGTNVKVPLNHQVGRKIIGYY